MAAPSITPCADWCTEADVKDNGTPGASGPRLTLAIDAASSILYRRSGMQFSGECEVTVRPCSRSRASWSHELPSDSWGDLGWVRGWGACGCHEHPALDECGCAPLHALLLGAYPVVSITEVKQGGAVVAAAGYQVVDYRWLMRVDGTAWLCCQDLTKPDTEPGTLSVKFKHGIPPPPEGKLAAAVLAGEIYKGRTSDESCRLPERTRSVTRDGISYDIVEAFTTPDQGGMHGRFGIFEVDVFLDTWNPAGLTMPSTVINPDLATRPSRRVAT